MAQTYMYVVLFHCSRRLKAEKDRSYGTDPIGMVSRMWNISRMLGSAKIKASNREDLDRTYFIGEFPVEKLHFGVGRHCTSKKFSQFLPASLFQ